MLKDLMRRIQLVFGTGIVTRIETKYAQIKMAIGTTNDRIKRVHNYGFMSRPLVGSKAYTFFIAGDTSKGFAFFIEDERHEIELQEGEVAVLDNKGNLIHLTENGIKIKTNENIEIEAAKDVNITCVNATIDATKTTINSETEINGKTTINGETTITANTTITGICAVGGLTSAGGGTVTATGGMVMTGGDIEVDGISVKTHTHAETGDGGGTTSPPQ